MEAGALPYKPFDLSGGARRVRAKGNEIAPPGQLNRWMAFNLQEVNSLCIGFSDSRLCHSRLLSARH